jgi:hypothetical protein
MMLHTQSIQPQRFPISMKLRNPFMQFQLLTRLTIPTLLNLFLFL